LKFGAGLGTNNRAEFYALWILMKIATNKGINKLQVLGDSKMLMDWANGKFQITNMALGPIMNRGLEEKKILM
jgi:ribonuclease HI